MPRGERGLDRATSGPPGSALSGRSLERLTHCVDLASRKGPELLLAGVAVMAP
jgi:hypothetical protein